MCIKLFSKMDLFCLIVLATFIFTPTWVSAEEWIYTIKPGDNLWNLTERHLTHIRYVERLQKLNNIQNPYAIPPGTRIRVPLAWTRLTDEASAHVIGVHGSAYILRTNHPLIPVEPGMQLRVGDKIQSEEDAFVTVEFADKSRMRVQDNTQVHLENMQIFGDYGLVDTSIYLEQGRTENATPEKPEVGTRFRIKTPSAISSVRGTDFRVGTLETQTATTNEVLAGQVEVSGGKRNINVPAGFGTITAQGTSPKRPVKLLPPPDLSQTENYYESLPLVIHVKPLSDAHAYRTQIASDESFNNLISEFTTTTLPFRDGDIPDGDYWLRIRGIDASGIEGRDAVLPFSLNARPEPPFITAPLPGGATAPENQEFSWTAQSTVSHYAVMISQDQNFSSIIYFNPEIIENSLTLPESLPPGHYFWRIYSVSTNEGAGPFSDVMSFRVPYPGPSLEETQFDESEMTFVWRAPAEGQHFHFQLAQDESFTDILYDELTPDSRVTVPILDGGTYFLRTKTIESDGFEGPWSPPQIIEIPHDMPFWMLFLLLLPLLVLI